MFACMCVCMYVCMYVCVCIYMYVCIYECMCVGMYVCLYIVYMLVYMCLYACMYVCMCVYICMHNVYMSALLCLIEVFDTFDQHHFTELHLINYFEISGITTNRNIMAKKEFLSRGELGHLLRTIV